MTKRSTTTTVRKPLSIGLGLALIVVFVALSLTAAAQKIGYVSSEAVKAKYLPAMQAEERLKQAVDGWKQELEQYRRDIEDLELEMKKNRLIWSDQEREQHQRELDDRKKQRDSYARDKFEPGGEYDRMAEELYEEIWEKVHLAIQKVAAADGYDIVWDKSSQPLVYVNAKFDLTVKVMKELGIDADELERKQQDVIDADPRNQKQRETRQRRSRRRSTSRPEPDEQGEGSNPTASDPAMDGMNPGNLPPVAMPTDTVPPPKEEDIPR